MIATIIDSVIVLLLIGSIGYGYIVSMKLRKLMATLKQLEPLVEEFSTAVDKSEQSVSHMRESIETAKRTSVADQDPPASPQELSSASFASRRAAKPEEKARPGVRVVRDKKELVKAFFENSATAKG